MVFVVWPEIHSLLSVTVPETYLSDCTVCVHHLTLKVLNFWKFPSYYSLKPLWSGMGEVVPARTSPTLHPPSPPTVHQLSRLALLRVKQGDQVHCPDRLKRCICLPKGLSCYNEVVIYESWPSGTMKRPLFNSSALTFVFDVWLCHMFNTKIHLNKHKQLGFRWLSSGMVSNAGGWSMESTSEGSMADTHLER